MLEATLSRYEELSEVYVADYYIGVYQSSSKLSRHLKDSGRRLGYKMAKLFILAV